MADKGKETSTLRQRKQNGATKSAKKQAKSKKATAAAAAKAKQKEAPVESADDEPVAPREETLWETFMTHPLVKISIIILIPFAFYRAYYYCKLQNPGIFGNLLRPAVREADERQLLIVGTISSGTVQVASDLYEHLKLEVSHEAADANWYFVRDGSISWFHGIRFMERQERKNSIAPICLNYTANMGFHPTMYRSDSGCSVRDKWSRCWALECLKILDQEWGCGLHVAAEDDELSQHKPCETPFRRTLHQVRHPLRTVESLVTKFCVGGVDGPLHNSFRSFMGSVITSLDMENDSCIESSVKYVIEYNRAMMKAKEEGFIFATYQVESTSPCQVAELAGFMTKTDVVYEPNYEKLEAICSEPFHPAKEPMKSTKNKVNQGQLALGWKDLRGGVHGSKRKEGDRELEEALRSLTVDLGYDPEEERSKDETGEFY